MDPDSENLESLTHRIRQAEDEKKAPVASGSGSGVGFDFVGALGGCGLIGALADHFWGTSPWCFIAMVIVGFMVGIWSAWKTMQKSEDTRSK